MSLQGNLKEYSEHELIENYLERFEMFMAVNGVEDDLELSKFLTVYGGNVLYEKIKIVTHPQAPYKVKYTEMKPKLISVLKTQKVSKVERSRFYSRVQKRGESVSEFAFELKKIASNCDFSTHLNVMLRDRFIYNLENDYIKRNTVIR